jgi:hypothetical protein
MVYGSANSIACGQRIALARNESLLMQDMGLRRRYGAASTHVSHAFCCASLRGTAYWLCDNMIAWLTV